MSKANKSGNPTKQKLELEQIFSRGLFEVFQSLKDRIDDREIITSIRCELNQKGSPNYMTLTLLSMNVPFQKEPTFSKGRLHIMWDNNGHVYKAERT
jgi:hypothetical protein